MLHPQPRCLRLPRVQAADPREKGMLISDSLSVPVCNRDGGQVGPVAFTGGGCRSRQSGAAQPAGGGEEVGDRPFPAAAMTGAEKWLT